jgi:hypothetical protein
MFAFFMVATSVGGSFILGGFVNVCEACLVSV